MSGVPRLAGQVGGGARRGTRFVAVLEGRHDAADAGGPEAAVVGRRQRDRDLAAVQQLIGGRPDLEAPVGRARGAADDDHVGAVALGDLGQPDTAGAVAEDDRFRVGDAELRGLVDRRCPGTCGTRRPGTSPTRRPRVRGWRSRTRPDGHGREPAAASNAWQSNPPRARASSLDSPGTTPMTTFMRILPFQGTLWRYLATVTTKRGGAPRQEESWQERSRSRVRSRESSRRTKSRPRANTPPSSGPWVCWR